MRYLGIWRLNNLEKIIIADCQTPNVKMRTLQDNKIKSKAEHSIQLRSARYHEGIAFHQNKNKHKHKHKHESIGRYETNRRTGDSSKPLGLKFPKMSEMCEAQMEFETQTQKREFPDIEHIGKKIMQFLTNQRDNSEKRTTSITYLSSKVHPRFQQQRMYFR